MHVTSKVGSHEGSELVDIYYFKNANTTSAFQAGKFVANVTS